MMRIQDLKENDLLEANVWSAWRTDYENEFAKPEPTTTDFDEDKWYISLTEYVLNNGLKLNGMLKDVYQVSHYVVFHKGRQIPIGDWDFVEKKEAALASKLLELPISSIYPITFECVLYHRRHKVIGKLYI